MTEAFLVAAVVALFAAGARWLPSSPLVRRGWPIWGKVAHAHLKRVVVEGDFAAVTGWAGELAVRFETHVAAGPMNGTRLIVWHPTRLIDGLTLRPETRSRLAEEIELGDPAFDNVFRIGGDPTLARALLDAGTRRRLLDLARDNNQLHIVDGAVRLDIASTSRRVLSRRLSQLVDAVRLLTQPRSVADRLAAIAVRDPQPEMRRRAVTALSRQFREEGGAIAALRLACDDASPEVRFEAASALGPEGRATLLDLAERGARCAPRAIDAIDGGVPPERVIALLEGAAHDDLELARACLGLLGRIGSDACIAALVGQLEIPPQTLDAILGTRSDALAAAAAAALGHTGSPRAEAPLIAALARPEADVRTAVAQALGRVGSAAAVVSLKEAAEASHDGDFRRAVRQAVAEIRSRLGGSPGELSMATSEIGQLSIAGAESGQVSLADDRAGGVSVSPVTAGENGPKDER
jgi:HEAT repeat protein